MAIMQILVQLLNVTIITQNLNRKFAKIDMTETVQIFAKLM